MHTHTLDEAKLHLGELIEQALRGEPLFITEGDDTLVKVTMERVLPEALEGPLKDLSPRMRSLLYGYDQPTYMDIKTPFRKEIEMMFYGEYGNSAASIPSQQEIDRIDDSTTRQERDQTIATLKARGILSEVEDETLRVPDDFDSMHSGQIAALFGGDA